MKATKTSEQAASKVDVRRNGQGGTIYKCLGCGYTVESNAYSDETYKAMMKHAANCDGVNRSVAPCVDKPTDLTALNDYVKAMAGHIKSCVPNGEKLSNHEAIALARISMATGLSPFTGELYYLPGKGPHIGIEGLRRKAKEQSLYSVSPRPMTPEENEQHEIRVGEGEIGYVCELWRHDVTQQAAQINQIANDRVIKVEPVQGIGIYHTAGWQVTSSGKPYPGDGIPNGRSAAWVAKKRAEADALRQAYDIGINLPYSDGPDYLPVADENGEGWAVISDEQLTGKVAQNAERRAQAEEAEPESAYDDIVAGYLQGERTPPDWLLELKQQIQDDPKAGDPVKADFVSQLRQMAEDRISPALFGAFLKVLFAREDQQVEELTFGAVKVLKPFITDNEDFETQVAGLLS